MTDSTAIDILIIGGGVVGLAVARELTLAMPDKSVILIERHHRFGEEISSRNSEVVHAGLYYASAPLKEASCVLGREKLYDYARRYNIPHRQCGKLICATTSEQLPELERLATHASQTGVPLEMWASARAQRASENPKVIAAGWSPTTGIISSHGLMQSFASEAETNGATLVNDHSLVGVEESANGFRLRIEDAEGQDSELNAAVVINCAGLSAAKILSLFSAEHPFSVQPCRGRYFSISARMKRHHLLYPLPDPRGGLGIHLTFDLEGNCRLGPDVDWSQAAIAADAAELNAFTLADEAVQEAFFNAGRTLLPELTLDSMAPGYIGVRPKLFAKGAPLRDFVVHEHRSSIHLLGIESPGLTSALSLAEQVVGRVRAMI